MELNKLHEAFKMHVPIKDGEWWNGKPIKYSNLQVWNIGKSQGFGTNGDWYRANGINIDGHNGLDLAFRFRTPIVAPCKMSISYFSNTADGYGRYIFAQSEMKVIDGQEIKLEMVFAHLDEIICEQGKWYDAGEIIGYGDSTGFSTGNHLHFGIRPLVNNNGWKQMFVGNGYLAYVPVEPFLIEKVTWTIGELEQLNEEIMSNVKILKDKNSATVGYFLPCLTEAALVSMAENYGFVIPTTNGKVDWDKVQIDGEFTLS